jgi:hypothetical protein
MIAVPTSRTGRQLAAGVVAEAVAHRPAA